MWCVSTMQNSPCGPDTKEGNETVLVMVSKVCSSYPWSLGKWSNMTYWAPINWAPIRLKIWNPPDEPKAIISGARQGVMSGAWHGIGMSLEFSICWKSLSGLTLHCVQHPFLPMTWYVSKPYGAPFCGACTSPTVTESSLSTCLKTWPFCPIILLMADIPNNHLGCIKSVNHGMVSRISEPSTVALWKHSCFMTGQPAPPTYPCGTIGFC